MGADQVDVGAHRFKDRPAVVKNGLVAADHDRQCAIDRAHISAANGRVKHGHASFLQGRGHRTGAFGRNRAHIDDDRALFSAVNRALLAHEHRLHIGRVRDDTDNNVRTARRGLGRSNAYAASRDDLVDARPVAAVIDPELIPGLEQVFCHGRAHDPQADKADLRLPRCCCHGPLPSKI